MSRPPERIHSARTACFSEPECIRLSCGWRRDSYFKSSHHREHRGTQGNTERSGLTRRACEAGAFSPQYSPDTRRQIIEPMPKILRVLFWIAVSVLGALALATIALHRGEQINALWLVVAAVATYAVGYRFYSSFISAKVLALDPLRATPAERLDNGRDFMPTNKWVVFGHHFAAIAGPGPLVGPVLAAQFGYLPGTLWILAGAIFAGCVQDFVILVFSVRRDGKSLGQMAREEIGKTAGTVAFIAVLSILVILLAVVALIIVNALKDSPWGVFTIAMTIPIALLMGVYLRYLRPGRVLETSLLGFVLVMLSVIGGQWVSRSPGIAGYFTLSASVLAILIIIYGFAASVLPVWLLL